jgi:hypothetical protein
MEDIQRFYLLSAHLKMQCIYFSTQVATQTTVQKNISNTSFSVRHRIRHTETDLAYTAEKTKKGFKNKRKKENCGHQNLDTTTDYTGVCVL